MLAEQQSFDADGLVEVGAMHSGTGTAYLKISAFRGCAIRETAIPPDGNGNRAAVLEINRQRAVGDSSFQDSGRPCPKGRHPFVRPADDLKVAQRFIAGVQSAYRISPRSGRLTNRFTIAHRAERRIGVRENPQSQSSVSRTHL